MQGSKHLQGSLLQQTFGVVVPQLTLSKTGKGSVFIGTVSETTNIAMTGTGAVSANQTDNLSLIQQGWSPPTRLSSHCWWLPRPRIHPLSKAQVSGASQNIDSGPARTNARITAV